MSGRDRDDAASSAAEWSGSEAMLPRRKVLQGLAGAGAIASGVSRAVGATVQSLSVETLDPSSVATTGATLDGNLLDMGGAGEVEVSFEYGEEGSDERQETPTLTLAAPGEFSVEVSDLDPETTYSYTAAAATDSASATGDEVTFTTDEPSLTVETGEATDVTEAGATLAGEVLDLGSAETVAAAFEYWVEGSDERQETLAETLSAPGSYAIAVDGLEPETTYSYRAIVDADAESASGAAATFTTRSPPLSVETGQATDVGTAEATLGGELLQLGGAETGQVAVEYWIDGEGSETATQTDPVTLDAPGAFEREVSDLDPGTTYAFRAVADTSEESAVGVVRTFTTEHLPLTVETVGATDVGETSATITGELTELGAADAATVAFEYWPSAGGTARETAAQAVSAPGAVEAELTGLKQDTAYEFRAVADSGSETAAGVIESFETPLVPVSLPTVDRTAPGDATFSQWGDGYRIRASGKSPWQRPRDEHGYGATYGEFEGDVVVGTTVANLRGEHDLRLGGLLITNDVLSGGGLAGDLLLAIEPTAGISLATYDASSREYETLASASPPPADPVDLRLRKLDDEFLAEYRRATDTEWDEIGSVVVPEAAYTQQAAIFATAGHDADQCVADFSAFRIGETGVALLPSSRELAPELETTFDLVVENADRGIRSFTVTVDVGADLLTIEDVVPTGDPVHSSIEIRPDGSTAEVEVALGDAAHDPGDVTIAELVVRTREEGTVPITLPEVVIVDDLATVPYDITSIDGATVTIDETAGPPPIVGESPPRDLDGDGLYRDIDGNGTFNITDVQVFMQNYREDVVQNNPEYFNFAGDDPPRVSLEDVQVLFQELVADDSGTLDAGVAEIGELFE